MVNAASPGCPEHTHRNSGATGDASLTAILPVATIAVCSAGPHESWLVSGAQVIRFFLYTILYWTLPRDRVIEPEEEEQPLAPSDDAKSDARTDAKKDDPEKDGKDQDVEMGTTMFADSSRHSFGQPIAADRKRSTTLGSLDLGRRQSLGRDINRHKSLESLGSQELFGWHRDALGQELSPSRPGPGRSGSAALESRSSLQTALSYKKSPRDSKRQAD